MASGLAVLSFPGGSVVTRTQQMKRHHNQGNFYERKHLIRVLLPFLEVSPLLSWWETGRHGAGAAAEDYALISRQLEERE